MSTITLKASVLAGGVLAAAAFAAEPASPSQRVTTAPMRMTGTRTDPQPSEFPTQQPGTEFVGEVSGTLPSVISPKGLDPKLRRPPLKQ